MNQRPSTKSVAKFIASAVKQPRPRLRAVGTNLLVFLCYALLTLLMIHPVVVHLTTRLVGRGNDPWVHYWNNWWIDQALGRGISPYYTDMLFHPNGASMVYHNFGWLNIVGSLALKPLLGPIGAYNAVFLLNIALCGYSMYHLAQYVLKHRQGTCATARPRSRCCPVPAAFVAGLVHAFWPYRLAHTAHPNLICTQWMVWFLLYLIKTVRDGERRHVLLAALFLILTALARLQLFVLVLFPATLYLLYSLFAERERWNRQTIGRLGLIGALTGVILACPLFPLVREQIAGEHPGDVFIDEQARNQSDLLAYVVPTTGHRLRKEYLPHVFNAHVVFLGYTSLGLAIYGAIKADQRAQLWLLIGVFSFVMALGPCLRFAGKVYPKIPLPYRLLGWSFPVRILRNPHRFNILLVIPVAVLVGYGIHSLSKRWVSLVPSLAIVLILFEYLRIPLPIMAMGYSPFYDQLATTPGQFGLYDLPMGFSGSAKFYMYLQTIHGKPVVQGKMSRPERTINAFIDGDPFTKHLRLTKNEIDPELTAVSRHLAYLADAGVPYLILHRDPQLEGNRPSPEQWAAWQDWLTIAPSYQDDRIAVYHTRPRYGRDFDFARDLGAAVGVIRVGQVPDPLIQGNILEFELRWGSRAAPERDLKAQFSLVDEGGETQQSVKFQPCDDWPTSEWPSGAIAIGRYEFQVDPHLPPGRYALKVELVDAGGAATLTHIDVEPLPRTFEPPARMEHTLDARFGSDFQLLGYDLAQESDALKLTLHWKAIQRSDGYYKVFVHLLDLETGAVVAQHDAVPCNWTYPTNWWEANEVVSEEIKLSTEELPPGKYQLAVGMYRAEDDQRLPVTGVPDESRSDDRLLLWEGVEP